MSPPFSSLASTHIHSTELHFRCQTTSCFSHLSSSSGFIPLAHYLNQFTRSECVELVCLYHMYVPVSTLLLSSLFSARYSIIQIKQTSRFQYSLFWASADVWSRIKSRKLKNVRTVKCRWTPSMSSSVLSELILTCLFSLLICLALWLQWTFPRHKTWHIRLFDKKSHNSFFSN